MTTIFKIGGMHCASCKNLIEDVAADVSGVAACRVDAKTGFAEVEHDPSFNPADLIREIVALGEYKIEIV